MSYLFADMKYCIGSGTHLSDCDADGYCNLCGNQGGATFPSSNGQELSSMNPVTDTQLEQTVNYIQNVIDTYMAAKFPTLTRKVVTVIKGKKYAKLVVTDTGRYAYGFIDLTNGDLLKAASWKAPALNFPRGNIHTNDLRCCGTNSIG